MKSLKSLLTLGITLAIASTSFAETTSPLTTVKENTTQAVTSVKKSAKTTTSDTVSNTLSSTKESTKNKVIVLKETTETKASSVKENLTTKSNVSHKGKVNINTADAKTLQTLSGIGEAKAQAIINYRNKNGGIKNLTELSKVSGIGETTLEKIKPSISF